MKLVKPHIAGFSVPTLSEQMAVDELNNENPLQSNRQQKHKKSKKTSVKEPSGKEDPPTTENTSESPKRKEKVSYKRSKKHR